MNPTDNSNQNSFSLHRDQNGMQSQQMSQQSQQPSDQSQPQQGFVPFAAFPANQPRDYDMNIKQMVIDLVERKYCPNTYIAKYQQLSAQDPNKFPPLDENTINMLRAQGQDISPEIRDFEVARVYNKLEIEIFEMSTSHLPQNKQEELRMLTEQALSNPGMQGDITAKIKDFIQMNVPNISLIVDQYMRGFMNQYLAGRY